MAAREIDVVVVGGGPAGLAAATELKRRGIGTVVLLEREPVLGGIPRHCGHSPFGMREFHRILSGTGYAARLEAQARAAGVTLFTRHSVLAIRDGVVSTASPEGLRDFAPRRVLLATGTREKPRSARLVSGERPLGILNTAALQSYVHVQGLVPFRRPVIVGTELVAMSAILTCRSAGIRPVAVLEKGSRPTARFPFHLLPRLLGIPLHYGAEITGIEGKGRLEQVSFAAGGLKHAVACDGLLFTGDFTPEAALAHLSGLAIDDAGGGPLVDAFGRTSDARIFAAGNLLRPVETAGWCWAEGRRIAAGVAADLRDGLPDRADVRRIDPGRGIKLVMPQEIGPEVAGLSLPNLQVRLDAKLRGRLEFRTDHDTIWSRAIDSGPERRILVPIVELPLPAGRTHFTLRVTGDEETHP